MGEDIFNFGNIERGVKQGECLNPNLFKIYINDLPDIFDDSCHPVALETLTIKILSDVLLFFLKPNCDGLILFSYISKRRLFITEFKNLLKQPKYWFKTIQHY
jgi:hypothetical protein